MQVVPGDPRVERDAVDLIAASPEFAARVTALSAETGRTPEDIESDARACLTEMAAQVGPQATEVWDRFGRWLTRSYTVDAETAAPGDPRPGPRALAGVPAQPPVLPRPAGPASALDRHGFPPNHILGGINLAMWPLSAIAKRAGMVFIRRQIREDPVYPAMLRLYLGYLLRIHGNLEWYFEGGRRAPASCGRRGWACCATSSTPSCRTGRRRRRLPGACRPSSTTSSTRWGRSRRGDGRQAKTPESLGWLVGFARAQSRRRGRVHVRFGRAAVAARRPWRTRRSGPAPPSPHGGRPPGRLRGRPPHQRSHARSPRRRWSPSSLLDNDGRALTLVEMLRRPRPGAALRAPAGGCPLTSDVDLRRPDGLREPWPPWCARAWSSSTTAAGAGLLDPARPAARGRLLPQHPHALLPHPGHRGAGRRGRAEPGATDATAAIWDGRAAAARPAQVRVLLPPQAGVRRRGPGRGGAWRRPGWEDGACRRGPARR